MILLIGLDGYDYRWASLLEQAGYSVAPMHSPVPLSWVAWNTLGTGVDAESWDVSHDPNDYLEFERNARERPSYLWEHAADAGKRSVIVNWPFVLKPRAVPGVLVCGYPAPASRFVVPESEAGRWQAGELDLSPAYGLDGESQRQWLGQASAGELLALCRELQGKLAQRFVREVRHQLPQLAFLGLHDCDRLSHYANAAMQDDAFRNEALTSMIAAVEMLERELAPDCIILFSDHGLDLEAPARTGAPGFATHGPNLPDCQTGVLALKQPGYSLSPETAQQIDVAPMVLNRLGVAHELAGIDRSAPIGE